MIPWPPRNDTSSWDDNRDPYDTSADTWVDHPWSGNYQDPHEPEEETEEEVKARLRVEHKKECQQAFRRPPKRCGRGRPPPPKWGNRKR